MIEYKGYIGVIDCDPGAEMQKSLEVYFEVCEEQGKIPDKPFSGAIN